MRRLRRLLPVLTFLSLVACSADATSTSPSDLPPEVPEVTEPPRSTPPEDRPEEKPETIAVEHERELRAAWIHYVWNGVWPSRSGMTQAEAKAELVGLFDGLAAARMNAVFLQVRTEGGARRVRARQADHPAPRGGVFGQRPIGKRWPRFGSTYVPVSRVSIEVARGSQYTSRASSAVE